MKIFMRCSAVVRFVKRTDLDKVVRMRLPAKGGSGLNPMFSEKMLGIKLHIEGGKGLTKILLWQHNGMRCRYPGVGMTDDNGICHIDIPL